MVKSLPCTIARVAAVPWIPSSFQKSKLPRESSKGKREITKEWMKKAKIDARSISMRKSSPIDVLPYVLTIIAPDVGRAAGYDFMSQNESKELKRAVDVTRSAGLTYAKPSLKGSFDRKTYGAGLHLQPALMNFVKIRMWRSWNGVETNLCEWRRDPHVSRGMDSATKRNER